MVATQQREPSALAVAEKVSGWLRPVKPGELAARTAAWGPDEWEAARQAALVHGIAPLLATRLERSGAWPELAPQLRAYCAEQRALNGRRVALMLDDLAAILRSAAEVGIAVLPLKGAVLATQFYPEPGLRPMADLDLLVHPAQADALGATLGRLGFRLVEETPRHRSYLHGEPRVVSWDGEHPDNPRGVEVHTAVGERLRAIRYDITPTMWTDVSAGSYAGALGLSSRPGALLQHLLIHTCHNMVNRRLRLIQLHDIALVAPGVDAHDWHVLVETAIRAGEARLLYAPLVLAEAAFGPLAPDIARTALARATPPALRRLLQHTTPSELSLCAPAATSPGFRLAWYRPGRERLVAVLRVLVPAAEELRQRYPAQNGLAGAYLRHARHTLDWAARAALSRRRQPVSQAD